MTFNILINYQAGKEEKSNSVLNFGCNSNIDSFKDKSSNINSNVSFKDKSKSNKRKKQSHTEKRLGVERLCYNFKNAQEKALSSLMKSFPVNIESVNSAQSHNLSNLMALEQSYRSGMTRLMDRQKALEDSGGDESAVQEIIAMQNELEDLHNKVFNGYDKMQSEAREKMDSVSGKLDDEVETQIQKEVMDELKDIFSVLKKN